MWTRPETPRAAARRPPGSPPGSTDKNPSHRPPVRRRWSPPAHRPATGRGAGRRPGPGPAAPGPASRARPLASRAERHPAVIAHPTVADPRSAGAGPAGGVGLAAAPDTAPTPLVAPGPGGPGYPRAPEAAPSGEATAPGPARRAASAWTWLAVAVVAALIGGAVGAIVTWAAGTNGSGTTSTLTIREGKATPGAATISGNVSIPKLVDEVLPAVVSIDVKNDGRRGPGDRDDHLDQRRGDHQQPRHRPGREGGTITVTRFGHDQGPAGHAGGRRPVEGRRAPPDQGRLRVCRPSPSGTRTSWWWATPSSPSATRWAWRRGPPRSPRASSRPSGRTVTGRRRDRGGHRDADQHDPDRRRHQPGELGRPADRLVRPGHRHEHGGGRRAPATAQRPEHRLRHPGVDDRGPAARAAKGWHHQQRRRGPRRRMSPR